MQIDDQALLIVLERGPMDMQSICSIFIQDADVAARNAAVSQVLSEPRISPLGQLSIVKQLRSEPGAEASFQRSRLHSLAGSHEWSYDENASFTLSPHSDVSRPQICKLNFRKLNVRACQFLLRDVSQKEIYLMV